ETQPARGCDGQNRFAPHQNTVGHSTISPYIIVFKVYGGCIIIIDSYFYKQHSDCMQKPQSPQTDSAQPTFASFQRQRRNRIELPIVFIIVGVIGFLFGSNLPNAKVDIIFGIVAVISIVWLTLGAISLSDSFIQKENERRKNKDEKLRRKD